MPGRTVIRRLQIEGARDSVQGWHSATPRPSGPRRRASGSKPSREAASRATAKSCPRPYVTGETLETARCVLRRGTKPALRDADRGPGVAARLDGVACGGARRESRRRGARSSSRSSTLLAKDARPDRGGTCCRCPPAGPFRYTAVLGDADADAFRATAERYRRYGFTDFKVKLSGNLERDRAKIAVFRGWSTQRLRVRVDANNLWTSADEAIAVSPGARLPVFRDRGADSAESVRRAGPHRRGARLPDRPGREPSARRADCRACCATAPARWLINLRVSKMGGLLRSLAVVDAARAAGIGLIVGAQVGETSLLTRAALTVAARPAIGSSPRKARSERCCWSATSAIRRSCSGRAACSTYRTIRRSRLQALASQCHRACSAGL